MNGDLKRTVRIFALGSPHGDDQAGWAIAARLAENPTLASFTHKLATPWDLVGLLVPQYSVIVIDACAGEMAAGTVLRLGESDLPRYPLPRPSTHGGSLIEALELARSLGKTVRELAIFVVAVEACEPGTKLSESARSAVEQAVQQIGDLLSEWLQRG